MIRKLKEIVNNAEASNSKFRVASIIVDVNGNEYAGVNLEYLIPTNSICAERNAISTAITSGMKLGELAEVHIYAISTNENDEMFTPPCGLCRQAILEASNGEAKIFLYNKNEQVKEFSILELLPEPFDGGTI